MTTFFIKKNSDLPKLQTELLFDGRNLYNSYLYDLTGSTIYFSMYDKHSGVKKILKSPTTYSVVDDSFIVSYQFNKNSIKNAGSYIGEFYIQTSYGDSEIIPIDGKIDIEVIDSIFDTNTVSCCDVVKTISVIPTPTPSVTSTVTPTPNPSKTPLPTNTPTRTPTNTNTPSVTNTVTPTSTTTPTNTNTPSVTNSVTPTTTTTPTNTNTPSVTNTVTPTITTTSTNTPTQSVTNTQTPTNTPTPTNTETPTQTPTNTVTPTNTSSPSPTPALVTTGLVIQLDAYTNTSYPGTGTTVFDITSGYNHTLTGANYVVLNGIKCFDCTTGTNRVVVNGTGPTLPTTGYTYITWTRMLTSNSGFRTVLYTNSPKYTPITIPNGTSTLGYWDTEFRSSGYDTSSEGGVWVQFAVVGTNSSQTFYINGSQVGSSIAFGAGGTTHWGWGNNDIVTQPWGHVANMYFYNRQLSLSEITQQYNFLAPRFVEPTPTPTATPTLTPTNTPNLDGFNYPDFSSISGLQLVGPYVTEASNELVLTSPTVASTGNLYRSTSIRYDRNFSLEWKSYIGGGTGADGYCIQWTTTNNTNGVGGGGIGRIADSSTINSIGFYTLSFNNFQWWKNNVLQSTDSVSAGYWRQVLYFWGDYIHSSQTFNLYFNTINSKPPSPNKQYTSFVFDSTPYYIGFGAATGGSQDYHNILKWNLTFT